MTENANPDQYKYSGYGTGFDARNLFSWSDGNYSSKDVTISGADMSPLLHIDNEKNDILSKVPTDGLDDTTLTAEKEYSNNFTEQQKKLCLSFHYNGANIYIYIYIYLLMVLK